MMALHPRLARLGLADHKPACGDVDRRQRQQDCGEDRIDPEGQREEQGQADERRLLLAEE